MAEVVQLRTAYSPLLSKTQLAQHLGRSLKWVELRVQEGMPRVAPSARFPRPRYDLVQVEAWLAEGRPKALSVGDRLALLEARIERLEHR